MQAYTKKIIELLSKHADPSAAPAMKRYMRDQFEYLGIKSPKMSELIKAFYQENRLPEVSELDAIARQLWMLPQREYQYIATGLIRRMDQQIPEEFIETLEYLLVTKSWWDTVDTISGGTLGTHFKRFPRTRRKYIARWRKSDNFWLRRATLLFQLGYKQETDFELLKELICENLGSKEFFINKAIGWSLRQYTRVDEQAVRLFVAATPLSKLSAKEALAWVEKKNQKMKEKSLGG